MVIWRSEDNFWELVLFFHHVHLRDQTRVVKLGNRCSCSLSHLARSNPSFCFVSVLGTRPRTLQTFYS